MEGDYSTQIDILILTWRQWEDNYYPPPPNPPFHDASPAPSNQQDSQLTPHRLSSSSSTSNRAPSQPTIDYSSWSPRSYQAKGATALNSDSTYETDTQLLNFNHRRTSHHRLTLDSGRASILIGTHHRNHKTATANQISFPNAQGIYPLKLFSLTFISRPIVINPLRSLWTINSTNLLLSLGEAQKDLRINSKSLTPSPAKVNVLTTKILQLSHSNPTISLREMTGSKRKSVHISAQPNLHTITGLRLSKQAQKYPLSSAQPNSHATKDLCLSTQAHNDEPSFDQEQFPPPITGLTHNLTQQTSLEKSNSSDTLFEPIGPNIRTKETPSHTVALPFTHATNSLLESQPITNALDPQQNRKQAMPTRRSQRILEKRNTFHSDQTAKKRNKTQANMIQFDKISHQSPLDASKTLQILQATGITISKQIEDLVEEAVK